MSDFRCYFNVESFSKRLLAYTVWYSLWRPNSPPRMARITTCRYSISSLFFPLIIHLLTVGKVSYLVNPCRGEIQGHSGQGWCYSWNRRSHPSRWLGVPEVLHFPHSRSWNSCCRSFDGDFWKKCHIPTKDSVLEEGSQLHFRRFQLPDVDRVYRHNCKSPHFFVQEKSRWLIRLF